MQIVGLWINTLGKMFDKDKTYKLIQEAGIDTQRAISPLENIDDKIVDKMMTSLSNEYKINKAELWKTLER